MLKNSRLRRWKQTSLRQTLYDVATSAGFVGGSKEFMLYDVFDVQINPDFYYKVSYAAANCEGIHHVAATRIN